MKLLLENWRKYLTEQYDWSTVTEDDLYDLSYEELIEMRDEINEQLAAQPAHQLAHPADHLLPTINARIEAIEESEMASKKSRIEDLYSGEFASKLAKLFLGSSKQGIDLASMIPDTEGLVEEFTRLRELIREALEYAEASDMAPWNKWDWNMHPRNVIDSVGALIEQLTNLPGENVSDMDEFADERKEIISIYDHWRASVQDLENYTFYRLHGRQPRGTVQQKLADSYSFIKDWVGEE